MARKKKEVVESWSIKDLALRSVEMPLLHPQTRKPLVSPATQKPAMISLVSLDSKEFYDAQAAAFLKLRQSFEKTKQTPSEQEQRDATYDMLAGLVTGWNEEAASLFADELGDGKYSKENAVKLLSQAGYFWITKQIEDFVSDKARFFPTR